MNEVYNYFNALNEFQNKPDFDSRYRFKCNVQRTVLDCYIIDNKDFARHCT